MRVHRTRLDPRKRRAGASRRKTPGASLDEKVRRAIGEKVVPGVAAALVRDGKTAFTGAWGLADLRRKRPVREDSIFQLASLSKAITGVAALQLFEQGRFGLDDPVSRHLGWELAHPRHKKKPITYRMLMTHTSGICDNWDVLDEHYVYDRDNPVRLGDFLRGYLERGGDEYDEDENFSEDAPGSAEDYSNVGVALLGHLVERISGQDFARYCADRIFAPLGMTSTTWIVSEVDRARLALPYIDRNEEDDEDEDDEDEGDYDDEDEEDEEEDEGDYDDEDEDEDDEDEEEDDEDDEEDGDDEEEDDDEEEEDDDDEGDGREVAPDWFTKGLYSTPDYPDGQLCSTAPDLARFFSAVMGWGGHARSPLLSEATRKLLFQGSALNEDQGLIWYRNEIDGRSLVGHEGDESGITTCAWVDPSSRRAAIVLMNGVPPDDVDLQGEITSLLLSMR